jgi:hypothetical protein
LIAISFAINDYMFGKCRRDLPRKVINEPVCHIETLPSIYLVTVIQIRARPTYRVRDSKDFEVFSPSPVLRGHPGLRRHTRLTSNLDFPQNSKEGMPAFEFMKQRIAAQLGGAPKQHAPLALALVALLHGTATLLLSADAQEKISRDFRRACLLACEALIHTASRQTARSKRPRRARRKLRLYR